MARMGSRRGDLKSHPPACCASVSPHSRPHPSQGGLYSQRLEGLCRACVRKTAAGAELWSPGMEWDPVSSSNGEGLARTAVSYDRFKPFFFFFLISVWLYSGNQDRGGHCDYPLRGSADLGGILLGERGEGDVLGAMIGSLALIL